MYGILVKLTIRIRTYTHVCYGVSRSAVRAIAQATLCHKPFKHICGWKHMAWFSGTLNQLVSDVSAKTPAEAAAHQPTQHTSMSKLISMYPKGMLGTVVLGSGVVLPALMGTIGAAGSYAAYTPPYPVNPPGPALVTLAAASYALAVLFVIKKYY